MEDTAAVVEVDFVVGRNESVVCAAAEAIVEGIFECEGSNGILKV